MAAEPGVAPAPLGAAVVGLGVGEQHARTYAAEPRCELRWLYDLDGQRAERLAAELHVAQCAPALDPILDDPRVGIVSIASYDDDHFGQVMAALEAGKHVFVEKPLCRSRDELAEVKRCWQAAGQPALASNVVLQAAPLYVWLKQAIASGELGDIYAFDGDYLYGRLAKITEGWRKDVLAYSVMQGGGVHLVDLMLWLTGQRPERVMAAGNRIASRGTAFRYNDFVAATFTFPSGLVGRICANFGCVHRHQHVLRVFGTKGTFIYDDVGPRLHSSRDPSAAARPIELSPLPSGKGDLIPAFVDSVLNPDRRAAAAQQAFDAISVCLSADASLQQGEPLTVEYA